MSSTSQAAPSTSQLVVKNEGIQTGNIKTVQSGQNERLEMKDIKDKNRANFDSFESIEIG